jgi:hypothetical protein
MVIDSRDDLAFPAVGQEQARRDVQLPQLHRSRALPPPVLGTAPAARHRLDQPMTDQHPVDRGPGDIRVTALGELEDQPARTPPAVRRTQVTDHRLDFCADSPWMLFRGMRPVSQAANSGVAVTGYPAMHRLPGHPETLGDLSDRDAIQDFQHGPVSLLDHVQLPKHCGSVAHQVKPRCRKSSGA